MDDRDDLTLVARSRGGDDTATISLIERLAPMLVELSDDWQAAGHPMSEFIDAVAPAISAAIASFDGSVGITFRAHATRCLQRALEERLPAPRGHRFVN